VNALGGYRVQGKTADAAEQLIRDARAVEAAGGFRGVVLEAVPRELAAHITRELRIPTIRDRSRTGVRRADSWLLHDAIGTLLLRRLPKFARRYANVGGNDFKNGARVLRTTCERECFLRMPSLIMRREPRRKKKRAPVNTDGDW